MHWFGKGIGAGDGENNGVVYISSLLLALCDRGGSGYKNLSRAWEYWPGVPNCSAVSFGHDPSLEAIGNGMSFVVGWPEILVDA